MVLLNKTNTGIFFFFYCSLLFALNYKIQVSSELKEKIKGKTIVYSKNNLNDGKFKELELKYNNIGGMLTNLIKARRI